MKRLLIELFGSYVPITYTNAEGLEIIPNGLSGVDIPYVLGVLLFGITLWQFLSLARGLINRD